MQIGDRVANPMLRRYSFLFFLFLTSRFGYYLGFAPLFVEVPQAPYHRQN